MKLFISMPMRNKKPEEIEALMKKYHRFCEKVILDNPMELIESHDPEGKWKSSVEALAESLKLMKTADFVFFAPGWEDARSCRIENAVCEAYGINWTDGNHWREYLEEDIKKVTLRECPHCGADYGFLARMNETNAESGRDAYYVMCCNCGARSGRTGDEISADKEWNRRHSDSENAHLPSVDIRMVEVCGDTEGENTNKTHGETVMEIAEHLAKEILSRVKEHAADEDVQKLIRAHREMMECVGMIPVK